MSSEQPAPPPAPKEAEEHGAKKKDKDKDAHRHTVVIRSRPKVVFLYPLLLAALVAGIWTQGSLASGVALDAISLAPGRIFFWVFVFNMLALSFDFTRGEFVALVLFFGVTILSILLLDQNLDVGIVLHAKAALGWINLRAHHHLYYLIALALTLVFLGVWVQGWFDYWEISHNEILHHKGFMGDLKRYPAPNLQLQKEIPDLFEHCLFLPFGGAGRIVIHPQGSERSVVLDNVIGVNRIEARIQHMLSSLQVKVDLGDRE
ncbi:MAG: hypothetical protein AB7N76_14830 [Planctomycetota bacterium]